MLTSAPHQRRLPTMRLSWEAVRLGAVANLRQVSAPTPVPAPDEAVVAVRAIGLNYADVFVALGLYEAANKLLEETGGGAFCPGLEFCGDVVQIGEEVHDVSVGDRVLGFSRFGAYRTSVVCPTRLLRRLPESWSYEEGAALLVAGLTAWHGLVELGAAREGSRVLVHSAAGGCGCAALSICESLGCSAVAVVGSEHKAAFLRSRFLGVSQPRILVRTLPCRDHRLLLKQNGPKPNQTAPN
jgi:NADPH:quinone reductase-like Zn-dependent oxidoreductase